MRFLTFLTVGILLFACGTKKNSTKSKQKDTIVSVIEPDLEIMKIKATIGKFAKESDPIISINSVEIVGNTLVLDVSYGGGCKEHQFEVIGSEMIAKSMPPIRAIQLVHHANGDNCRAIVRNRLEINIEDLAYQQKKGDEIYLTIEGWEERILYTFK